MLYIINLYFDGIIVTLTFAAFGNSSSTCVCPNKLTLYFSEARPWAAANALCVCVQL